MDTPAFQHLLSIFP